MAELLATGPAVPEPAPNENPENGLGLVLADGSVAGGAVAEAAVTDSLLGLEGVPNENPPKGDLAVLLSLSLVVTLLLEGAPNEKPPNAGLAGATSSFASPSPFVFEAPKENTGGLVAGVVVVLGGVAPNEKADGAEVAGASVFPKPNDGV